MAFTSFLEKEFVNTINENKKIMTGGPSATDGVSRRKLIAALGLGAVAVTGTPLTGLAKATPTPGVNIPDYGLKGKSAIVTGAARGIGRAICVALARGGVDILGIDMAAPVSPVVPYAPATADDFKETGRQVMAAGVRFIPVTADIRDMAAMRSAAQQAVSAFGKIDILIANAAIQNYAPVWELTDAQWKDVIDVNVTGTANCLRAVAPHMISKKTGRIILISSGQGKHGFKHASPYSTSKWAVLGLMKSAALDLAEHQITVNCVEPGLIDTPMTRNEGRWNLALKEGGKPEEGSKPLEADVIAARMVVAVQKVPWMQPDEVPPPVLFLCSDAAFRITGASYDVTAGDSAKYTA